MNTIKTHPHLFNVSTPIEVDHFESLLSPSPKHSVRQSVMTSLCEGFWPWANTNMVSDTQKPGIVRGLRLRQRLNKSSLPIRRDIEIEKKRFSPPFGPDLLPGMYSTPVLAVPKPHSDKLRLVSHQSCGIFSQNSMIDKDLTVALGWIHSTNLSLLYFTFVESTARSASSCGSPMSPRRFVTILLILSGR